MSIITRIHSPPAVSSVHVQRCHIFKLSLPQLRTVHTRAGKPIRVHPCLSEVPQVLPLKRFQCWFVDDGPFEEDGGEGLFLPTSLRVRSSTLSVCLSVCLSLCLCFSLSLSFCLCLSHSHAHTYTHSETHTHTHTHIHTHTTPPPTHTHTHTYTHTHTHSHTHTHTHTPVSYTHLTLPTRR